MRSRWLFALATAVAVFCMLAALLNRGFVDIAVYRFGADRVAHGLPLYDARDGLPFTYPPFAALLMLVILPFAFPVLVGIWTWLSMVALGRSLALVQRVDGFRLTLLTLAALGFEPVWSNLSFAQINLFLMLAIAWDLMRIDRRWAGVLIGVAAGIKLTPLLFVFFLVIVGRGRAAVMAVTSFLATVLVGFVVLGSDSASYWTSVLWDPNRVGGVAYAGNQSVLGVMTRLLGEEPSTAVWFVVAGAPALVALLVARSLWLRDERPLAICVAAVGMLVASPISWNHHWVWAVPLAVLLWERSRVAALAWSLVFCSHVIWRPPSADDREVLWNPFEQLIGNAYLWAALVLLAWLAVGEVRHQRAGRILPETSPSVIREPEGLAAE